MKAGFVYDPIYLRHNTGGHPENARRLEAVISHLEQTELKERLLAIKARSATLEELTLVHNKSHISRVKELAERGGGWLDPDTVVSKGSYNAALYAAGGAIEAVAAVMGGNVDSAFALVRPPGHHATPGQAMGFCLFNNVAIASRFALEKFGLERVAIIDFDVHHGNGTQEAFYSDPHVLYISTHQYPHYPGTGRIEETGIGDSMGTTINIPLPAGCDDAEYAQVFEQIIVPATRRFNPQLILSSAGYDGHRDDPLAMMQLTVAGYAKIAGIIRGLADELCQGRLVFCLEGGYNLEALAASVKATFEVMLGDRFIEEAPVIPSQQSAPGNIEPLIDKIKQTYSLE